jgi:hypothetical protein
MGDGSRDYPTRTLPGALDLVRTGREPGQRAVVWLHAGAHLLTETLRLGPADSSLTLAAWPGEPGEEVSIEGGVTVTGWAEDAIDGVTVWSAPAPARAGRSLYVAGERRERPRHPQQGWLRIAGQDGLDLDADLNATLFQGADRFTAAEGDLPEVASWAGVEAVVPHYWIQERLPVAAVDPATRTVVSDRRSVLSLRDGDRPGFARYALEGVLERLGEVPGQWYADRAGTARTREHPDGSRLPRLLYVPRPGEDRATFAPVVPVVGQLVVVEGTADAPVRDVRIEGVTLRYADWDRSPAARAPFQMREDAFLAGVDLASDPQAACSVPAAVALSGTRDVALVDCTVAHVGGYGVGIGPDVRGTLVSGCTIEDTGAGGITCGGGSDPQAATTDTEISDCEIRAGGRTYPHAVAVLVRHAARTLVAHNHVHDHFSTAVAIGWRWDYGASPAVDNRVEGNHLHDLGQGRLDWFGAVYTLGVSPGTVIRRNRVHDVRAARFGGWGLLIDPATSHVLVEQNLVHDVSSECLHVKTGRENTIRDNVLARGGTGLVSLAVAEPHRAATLTGNVLVAAGTPVISGAPGSLPVAALVADAPGARTGLVADLSTIWDERDGAAVVLAGDGEIDPDGCWRTTGRADDAWRAAGRDGASVIADPGLTRAADGRLTLTDPALRAALGPVADGLPDAGPRPTDRRRHPARYRTTPYPIEDGSL